MTMTQRYAIVEYFLCFWPEEYEKAEERKEKERDDEKMRGEKTRREKEKNSWGRKYTLYRNAT